VKEIMGFDPKTILYKKQTCYALISVIAFLIVILAIQMYAKSTRTIGSDFTSFLMSSEAFWHNRNPYNTGSIFSFIYPLFLNVVLFPLILIPYSVSGIIWFIVNMLCLFYSVKLLLKFINPEYSLRFILVAFSLAFIVWINVIQNNFVNGQINTVIIYFYILFFLFYLSKKYFLSALFLSMAVSIKLTPAILIIYLLFERRYAMVLMISGFTIIFIFFIPMLFTGPVVKEYYLYYIEYHLSGIMNSDLPGSIPSTYSIYRILCLFLGGVNKIMVFLISSIMVLIPVITFQVRTNHVCSKIRDLSVFSLYLLASLLISPMSETHHLILLIPVNIFIINNLIFPLKWSSGYKTGFILSGILLLIIGKFIFIAYLLLILYLYFTVIFIVIKEKKSILQSETER
jgi:hypothetical protein